MLVKLEQVDDVCIICNVRHIPVWLENLCERDVRIAMMFRYHKIYDPETGWLNVHRFTKRAFVPLEKIDV